MLTGRQWGDGPRQALLLHGATSSSACWWQVGPALAAQGWTVRAHDLPGHGDSASLPGGLDLAASAEAVLATVGEARFDVLVGHSFGAAVAVALLHQAPELTAACVLEELPGRMDSDWAAIAAAWPEEARVARADRDAAVARTLADQPRWRPEDAAHAVDDLLACDPEAVRRGLTRGAEWSRLPAAPSRVPKLLLLGDEAVDTALCGADRAAAAERLPADTQVVPGVGHCVHRDDPAGWLDAVVGFASASR